jgi:hypothetical protein
MQDGREYQPLNTALPKLPWWELVNGVSSGWLLSGSNKRGRLGIVHFHDRIHFQMVFIRTNLL